MKATLDTDGRNKSPSLSKSFNDQQIVIKNEEGKTAFSTIENPLTS
jgi:hypothetical protein